MKINNSKIKIILYLIYNYNDNNNYYFIIFYYHKKSKYNVFTRLYKNFKITLDFYFCSKIISWSSNFF